MTVESYFNSIDLHEFICFTLQDQLLPKKKNTLQDQLDPHHLITKIMKIAYKKNI